LAHAATQEGIAAVEFIAGRNRPAIDPNQVPNCIYCQPQVASVGLSESQARDSKVSHRGILLLGWRRARIRMAGRPPRAWARSVPQAEDTACGPSYGPRQGWRHGHRECQGV
jgi:pyruvate/2-oxoglutarate dehydrogenase complex dihydrolipoamide dehydrogenase (E3) component